MKRNCNSNEAYENKKLLLLFLLLAGSLVLSAIAYIFIGQDKLIQISYNSLKKYSYIYLFLEILKRNLIYFIVIAVLCLLGKSKAIYVLFFVISLYFGMSVIYLSKTYIADITYLLCCLPDYLIYYPFLFFFTHISILVSNYVKKRKKVETKPAKLDIIGLGYIKIICIFITIMCIYSSLYSYYVYIII